MNIIGERSYEVPSYVTAPTHTRHPVPRAPHVGAILFPKGAEDALRALVLPPLGGYRAYHVPVHVAQSKNITKFVRTGTSPTPDPTKETSGPGTGAALAVVGGVVALVFLVEAGMGYFTYRVSHWLPASAIIGFLTGGPVGLIASSLGGLAAARKG